VKVEITKSGSLVNMINGTEIRGRLATDVLSEWELFQKYVAKGNSYIETGVLFGGSLIVAGLLCDGPLHGIDPLYGFYGKGREDRATQLVPSYEIVMENVSRFPEINPQRVIIHQQKSYPWPEALEGMTFDTGFIDGDHTYKGCLRDWENMRECVTKHIIVDNIDHAAIGRLRKIFDGEWDFVREAGRMGVWRKPK